MANCKDCLHIGVCYMVEHYGVDETEELDCRQFQATLRPKERWGNPVKVDAENNGYKCSECGEFGVPCWHYCPNCGAKMEV